MKLYTDSQKNGLAQSSFLQKQIGSAIGFAIKKFLMQSAITSSDTK